MYLRHLLSLTALLGTAQLASAIELDAQLFPGIEQTSDEALRLAGLAAHYPGRVFFEDPAIISLGSEHEAARVETLPRDVCYIRIYRLEEAAAVLREHREAQSLIVDLRYLKSNSLGVDSIGQLARSAWLPSITHIGATDGVTLPKDTELQPAKRRQATVVLCNRETAGPFEAALKVLQTQGDIMAVGEATAGRTGFYTPSGKAWILDAELLADGDSLIGTGLEPRITVESTAQQNYNSYHLFESGTELSQLIRSPERPTDDESNNSNPDEAPKELDPVLQRGLEIVAALQILN